MMVTFIKTLVDNYYDIVWEATDTSQKISASKSRPSLKSLQSGF